MDIHASLNEHLLINEFKVIVERTLRSQRIILKINHDGVLKVRAGLYINNSEIENFIKNEQKWIIKQLAKIKKQNVFVIEKELDQSSTVFYLGESKKICILPSLLNRAYAQMRELDFYISVPLEEIKTMNLNKSFKSHRIRELYNNFLNQKARDYLIHRTQFLAGKHNLHLNKVRIGKQKSRWGSCSSNKIISLNQYLMVFHPSTIDYVILHELAHLVHLNHSKKFWELVESWMPDYQNQEQILKSIQIKL